MAVTLENIKELINEVRTDIQREIQKLKNYISEDYLESIKQKVPTSSDPDAANHDNTTGVITVLPEDTTSKINQTGNIKEQSRCQANMMKKLEDDIKDKDEIILKFQNTFTQMKAEIYKLRAENKGLKDNAIKRDSAKENHSKQEAETQTDAIKIIPTRVTKNKDSYTQTESTVKMKYSENNTSYGKTKFQHIECKYFYKGKGCRRGERCWFFHRERTIEEQVCQ